MWLTINGRIRRQLFPLSEFQSADAFRTVERRLRMHCQQRSLPEGTNDQSQPWTCVRVHRGAWPVGLHQYSAAFAVFAPSDDDPHPEHVTQLTIDDLLTMKDAQNGLA